MATGSQSSGLSLAARNAFWEVVEKCLVKFHNLTPQVATTKALEFRRELESPPAGIDGDIVYHEEPFYVACRLAGQFDTRATDCLLKSNSKKYKSLLAKHGW